MSLTAAQRRVREGSTPVYTAYLKDENGAAVPASDLETLTLTLYDKSTGDIINNRDEQSVLNTNNVTVDESGKLTWSMVADDNAIIGSPSPNQPETHIALFRWTWNSGAKASSHEVQIDVENQKYVP